MACGRSTRYSQTWNASTASAASARIPSIAWSRWSRRCSSGRVRTLARFMRLIVARCSVDYTGRLIAHLPEALRLLMIKSDGSVMVHADTRRLQAAELDDPADGDRGGRGAA